MDFASNNISMIIYKNPINMHRSFNGLLSLAFNELDLDLGEDIYVLFMNRDRNQFKILFFQYGHATIFTMRLSGSIQADFTKMDAIDSSTFHNLIKTVKSRKHRLRHVLGE